MSAWWQFRALIKKNALTLKRSIFMTLMEIFYPIILMFVGYLVKNSFSTKRYDWVEEGAMDNYLIDKGNFGLDYNIYPHMAGYNKFGDQYFKLKGIDDKAKKKILNNIIQLNSILKFTMVFGNI